MIRKLDYWRRLACKAVCFFFFGLGSLLIGAIVYPAILLFLRESATLRRATRGLIRGSFFFFVNLMKFFGLIRVEFANPEALIGSKGMIIVANHPSLIDVVILGSRIPQADCIVKRSLWDTPFVRLIVRRSYIPNSLGFEETARLCGTSLAEGNSLLVFPEGTRTKAGKRPRLGRGAARIALFTGRDILPVRISSNDVRGLRKGDPFLSLPRSGPVCYCIEALSPISVSDYAGLEPARGARALTRRLSEAILGYPATEHPDG